MFDLSIVLFTYAYCVTFESMSSMHNNYDLYLFSTLSLMIDNVTFNTTIKHEYVTIEINISSMISPSIGMCYCTESEHHTRRSSKFGK
jgi:hypothetical protein